MSASVTNVFPCCDRFDVVEYGNGWAYEVRDAESGQSFWVQDQDADELKAQSNNFTRAETLDDYMDVLGA